MKRGPAFRAVEGTQRSLRAARQAEFAAAHQLVRAHPHLTVAELRQALDQGGTTGQDTAGLPSDRAAYIARTAERVLGQPQRPTPEAHAMGVER